MSSIPEGCENIPVCCQCYHPQEVVGEYIDCEICGRVICLQCGSSDIHPFKAVCYTCSNAVHHLLANKKDEIFDPYRPVRLQLRRSVVRICPKCGYLVDHSILANFQGFDLFSELDKQFSEWNTKGKKK